MGGIRNPEEATRMRIGEGETHTIVFVSKGECVKLRGTIYYILAIPMNSQYCDKAFYLNLQPW